MERARPKPKIRSVLLLAACVPLIWTFPHRLGFCVGLDYLSRVYLGQPSDVPPFPDGARPEEEQTDGDDAGSASA